MKRAIIIHGWDGNPKDSWKPWLTKELEARKFLVISPQMPGGLHPKVSEWLKTMSESVSKPDEQTYFIGHSLGCISTARYLEALPKNTKVGGCIFISGFSSSLNIPEIEEFTNLPINFDKIKSHTNKFVFIHSDDDPDVPLEKAEEFKSQLGGKIILEHNKGHISESDGVKELPSALKSILSMSDKIQK